MLKKISYGACNGEEIELRTTLTNISDFDTKIIKPSEPVKKEVNEPPKKNIRVGTLFPFRHKFTPEDHSDKDLKKEEVTLLDSGSYRK